MRRFVREIVLALSLSMALAWVVPSATEQSAFVLAIGGVIASGHTTDSWFLLLAAIGTMRMFLELLFKMLPRDCAPGKFPSMVGRYTE